MRTIVHLSDLHFGRTDDALLTPLASVIAKLAPDLVAVSGDLTQRARTTEFQAARDFLDRLPEPQIIVPGNHDVPLHNVFTRFIGPLDKYRRYITGDLEPVVQFYEQVTGVPAVRPAPVFAELHLPSCTLAFGGAGMRSCYAPPLLAKLIVAEGAAVAAPEPIRVQSRAF